MIENLLLIAAVWYLISRWSRWSNRAYREPPFNLVVRGRFQCDICGQMFLINNPDLVNGEPCPNCTKSFEEFERDLSN